MIHSYTFTSDLTQKKKNNIYIYIYIPYKVIVKLKREINMATKAKIKMRKSTVRIFNSCVVLCLYAVQLKVHEMYL